MLAGYRDRRAYKVAAIERRLQVLVAPAPAADEELRADRIQVLDGTVVDVECSGPKSVRASSGSPGRRAGEE